MKKLTIKLTPDEWSVLYSVLSSAKECMEYDECCGTYTDGGRFLLSLDEDEYQTLLKIDLG